MSETVTLRSMTTGEYEAYTGAREDEVTRELSAMMPVAEARAQAIQGTARFLPDGPETARHHLLIAENAAGAAVGNAWVGPDPYRVGATDSAWLYDINVYPEARRHGYGTGILRAIEELVTADGVVRLGLNVFGSNTGAIALYEGTGFTLASQTMTKALTRAPS